MCNMVVLCSFNAQMTCLRIVVTAQQCALQQVQHRAALHMAEQLSHHHTVHYK